MAARTSGSGAIGISGPDAADFTLVGNTCSGQAIPSGGTCALSIAFKPGVAAQRVAGLDDGAQRRRTRTAHHAERNRREPSGRGRASAARRLAITKLRDAPHEPRARPAPRPGPVDAPAGGTEIVKIAVYRVRKGRVVRKPVWLGYRLVGRTGPYRIRLDSRALRRRLKVGLYQVNVTPGISRRELGRTSTTRVRITRR